jgi:murein endopeptidase
MKVETTEANVKDVANAAREVIDGVAKIVSSANAEAERLFFPKGIDSIAIGVTAAGVSVNLTVAGPKGSAAEETFAAIAATTGFVMLPQSSSSYYQYSTPDRQFGTQTSIDTITSVANGLAGNPLLGIGDISFADGSVMPPHAGHRLGKDADIRPMRKDKQKLPVTITDAQYDRAATKTAIDAFLANANVATIFFNDSAIPGVTPLEGHDNHFHVKMKA